MPAHSRTRTGCSSCRRRRIKCDERKPTCVRCERANVVCGGYDKPKEIVPGTLKRQASSAELSNQSHDQPGISQKAKLNKGVHLSPTTIYTHARAKEALAYRQYTVQTAPLLFEDHAFWNGVLVEKSWEHEFIFDAIIALGSMHRAVLRLDSEIVALEAYSNALKRLNEACGRVDSSLFVCVLLLLTYVESLAGNSASSFRHLRTAHHYLTNGSEVVAHRQELITVVTELSLVAQIVLPIEHFPLYASSFIPKPTNAQGSPPVSMTQAMINFFCHNPQVYRALCTPVSQTEISLDTVDLGDFRRRLLDIYESSMVTDEVKRKSGEDSETTYFDEQELVFPPKHLHFGDTDVTIAHALFHWSMTRVACMLDNKSRLENKQAQSEARIHAYYIMCIMADLHNPDAPTYDSCHAIKLSIIPAAMHAAVVLNEPRWFKLAASKLRLLGSEGLFNAEHFAKALEVINVFRDQAERELGLKEDELVWPLLFPDANNTSLAIYYTYVPPSTKSSRIVGRACFDSTGADGSERMTMEFYTDDHALNQDVLDACAYGRTGRHEPNVATWNALFSSPDQFIPAT